MKKLYKFYWDCGRSGSIESIFVATEKEVEKAIGKDVYFGEVLGKHSDVHGILEKKDLSILTSNPDIVKFFEKYENCVGLNPLEAIEDDLEEY